MCNHLLIHLRMLRAACLALCMLGVGTSSLVAASWVGVYSGPKSAWGYGILATSDGGYLVTGSTDSYGAGQEDALVMKLDVQGAIQWAHVMGGSLNDDFIKAIEMPDGGFAIAGGSYSFNTGSLTSALAPWLVRLDASGNTVWQKFYPCPLAAGAMGLTATRDGGFILCGHWWVNDSTYMAGLLMKVNANGDLLWANGYGPADDESFHKVLELPDGSLVASGIAKGATASEATILKADALGNAIWERRFEIINDYGSATEHASDLIETPDGQLLYGGGTPGQIRKLDTDGNTIWSLRVNAPSDSARLQAAVEALITAPEGGYYATGWYLCDDTIYCPPPTFVGAMLVKIGDDGTLQWAKVFDGYTCAFTVVALCPGQEGGLALAGYTWAEGEASNLLVVKTESDGSIADSCLQEIDMPAPWTNEPSQEGWQSKQVAQVAGQALVPAASKAAAPLNASNTICPVILSVTKLQSPFRLDIRGLGFTGDEDVYINGQRVPITQNTSQFEIIAKKGAALKAMLPKGQSVCIQALSAFHPQSHSSCFMFTR